MAVLACIVLVPGACSSGSGGDETTSGSGPSEPASAFERPDPDPVDAEVTLDDATAATSVIGVDGGRVETTGSDGRAYALEVPAGALVGDVAITITPIAELTTPVLAGFAGGAQLAPDGLGLAELAWLEIGGVDGDDLVAFDYLGDGDEVALVHLERTGDGAVRIPVTHFSGAGAGTPSEEAGGRPPSDPARQLGEALIAAYMDNDFECIGFDHPLGDAVVEWYADIYRTEVAPHLEAAAGDDQVLTAAVGRALDWMAARQHYALLLCEQVTQELEISEEQVEADELITAGLVNAIDTATTTCASTHDIGEVIHIDAWVARALMLFGDTEGDWEARRRESVERCLTFQLRFTSEIVVAQPGFEFRGPMTSTIDEVRPVAHADHYGFRDEGLGDWSFAPVAYTPTITGSVYAACPVAVTQVVVSDAAVALPQVLIPTPQRHVPLGVEDEASERPTDDGQVVEIMFRPLRGSEFFETTCTDLFGGANPDGAWGPWAFNELHALEMDPEWEGFAILLAPGSGDVLGTRTYQRTELHEDAEVTETTTFELVHTAPGGG